MQASEKLKFDLRTRNGSLRNGSLTKEELQKFLKSLPDESKNAEEVPVFEEATNGSEPTFSAL